MYFFNLQAICEIGLASSRRVLNLRSFFFIFQFSSLLFCLFSLPGRGGGFIIIRMFFTDFCFFAVNHVPKDSSSQASGPLPNRFAQTFPVAIRLNLG